MLQGGLVRLFATFYLHDGVIFFIFFIFFSSLLFNSPLMTICIYTSHISLGYSLVYST